MSAKKAITKHTYEALLICKPVLDLDSVDTVLSSFQKNLLEPKEGEVIKVDKIGRKRLAYEMNKFRDARHLHPMDSLLLLFLRNLHIVRKPSLPTLALSTIVPCW